METTARVGVDTPVADRPRTGVTLSPGWLDGVFLLGLAGVFIVNAAVALVHPDDFTGLTARSPIGRWLHLAHAPGLALGIAANDLLLGVAILVTRAHRARLLVLAWAGMWLLAVTVIKLTALSG